MDRSETMKEDYQKIYTHAQVREFDKDWAEQVLYFKKVYEKRIRKLKNNKKKLKKILTERNNEIDILRDIFKDTRVQINSHLFGAENLLLALKNLREYK